MSKIIAGLTGTILGFIPLGQYWAVIINVAIIISYLWQLKSMFYNLYKGYEQLKMAIQ